MNLAIDFGTSFTKIAYMADNVFINLTGANGIPSALAYLPKNQQLIFAYNALQFADDEVQIYPNFKLELKRNLAFTLGPYDLQDILYYYFLFLDETYIKPTAIGFSTISLAIPNYFGLKARNYLVEALNKIYPHAKIYMIPEPVAALAGHTMVNQNAEIDGDILVIDIGGGTSDFSFLTFSSDTSEIIIESQLQMGQDVFSGLEIDKAILNGLLLPNLRQEVDKQILENSYKPLIKLAEAIKIGVSEKGHYYINEPDLFPAYSLIDEFTHEQVLNVLGIPFMKLRQYFTNHLMTKARKIGLYNKDWQLDKVLLLGGTSQAIGIYNFWTNIFSTVPVIKAQDKTLNVVKGLAVWPEIINSPLSIKTIYPFNFYIQTLTREHYNLEPIPFDTSTLELDINGEYSIFQFPLNSVYNISSSKDKVKLKVYEAEEENEVVLDRFIGQNIVLDIELPKSGNEHSVEIKLDFATAKLTANYSETNYKPEPITDYRQVKISPKQEWLSSLHQTTIFSPEFNQDLLNLIDDDRIFLQPALNQELEFIRFKLLALLNYIS